MKMEVIYKVGTSSRRHQVSSNLEIIPQEDRVIYVMRRYSFF